MVVTRKAFAAAGALAASALLVGAYVRREAGTRADALAAARIGQMGRAGNTYLLRRGADPVGYSRLAVEPMGDSLLVREETELHLPAPGGMVQAAQQTSDQVLDASLRLRRFTFRVAGGAAGGPQQVTAIRGARRAPTDSVLEIEVETGRGVQATTVAAGPDVVLGSSLWPRLAASGQLRSGARIALTELDPASLALRPMTVDVGPPETVPESALVRADERGAAPRGRIQLFPVTQRVGAVTYRLWLTRDGLPVRAALPLGVTIAPAAVDEVLALRRAWATDARAGRKAYGSSAADSGTLIAQSAVAAGRVVLGARTARQLIVRATGVPLPPDAAGGAQRVRGDTVTIDRLPLPAPGTAGYVLAAVGASSPLGADARLRPYLAEEPFLEVTRPEIRAAAREALAGERDPARAAARLTAWVHARLRKSYTASIPSAVEVLAGGEGDCNEHTALTTALARAAGIPARPVSGLVYVDGAFFFHAWVELWLADRWVPVDPTFGLAPADPARVRLFAGMAQLNGVIGVLGQLKLSVLHTAPGAARGAPTFRAR